MLMAPPIHAQAPAPVIDREIHRLSMHFLGREVTFSIGEHDLDDSPIWLHPENDPPPFAIADGIRVASGELKRYVADPGEWRLCGVAIKTFERQAKWYYVVEWRPRQADYLGDGVSIPVLMTGRAVQGRIENE